MVLRFCAGIFFLGQWFSNLRVLWNPLEGPTIRVSDLVEVGWVPEILHILVRFPDADAICLGPRFEETWFNELLFNHQSPVHMPSLVYQPLLAFLGLQWQLLLHILCCFFLSLCPLNTAVPPSSVPN